MLVDRRTLLSRGPSLPRTSPPTADVWLRVHRAAMACRFEVLLSGEDRRHTASAHDALREADRLDAAWSIYRDDSVVSILNREAASAPVLVDAELFALLALAEDLWRRTDGAFDITTTPRRVDPPHAGRRAPMPCAADPRRTAVLRSGTPSQRDGRAATRPRSGATSAAGKAHATGAFGDRRACRRRGIIYHIRRLRSRLQEDSGVVRGVLYWRPCAAPGSSAWWR